MPTRRRTQKRGFSRADNRPAGRQGRRGAGRQGRPGWMWLLGAVTVLVAGGALAFVLIRPAIEGTPVPWAELGTADVHSLAFAPDEPEHLFFGHHGGLLESRNGGRTWRPTALRGSDAMNVRTGSGGLLQVAGHEVYLESRDGGQTWEPVPNDLPGLDLHAFVSAPADPAHAWAFAAGHGLFESTDAGRHWELRAAGPFGSLAIYERDGQPILVGLGQAGLARSEDGGRTWQPLSTPGGQLTTMAASDDGGVLYAGTTEGLMRSTDGGVTWNATGFERAALAIAVAPGDADAIAVVDDASRFFRSGDSGATWPGAG